SMSRTGEFNLESTLFLKLRGIHDLGCPGECMSLEKLDLSANNITNLDLAGNIISRYRNVTMSRIINMSVITFISHGLFLLNSIESLHCLQPLRKLKNIRLKDNTYNYSNPVCRNSAYRNTGHRCCSPNIKLLDGERVVGRGSDLYQLCKDIDRRYFTGLYKNGQLVEHSDCKPWVEDNYWEIKRSNNAIIEEAYKRFNGRSSSLRAPGALEHSKTESSLMLQLPCMFFFSSKYYKTAKL
uniref:Leucine rich repeat containing 61 n=1 Tax=Gasterosteus aculeatus aculeatus TaxID=481459 RepID=A0AAQ4PUT1_GASAC